MLADRRVRSLASRTGEKAWLREHPDASRARSRGDATQHHVMSIFADSARTKMYGSLRERAGGSCRVQVMLF